MLITPTPGSTLGGSSVAFTWSPRAGPTQYKLWLGTTPDPANLYSSGATTATTETVSGLPTTGATVYARLYSYVNGVWVCNSYSYKT